MSKVFVYGTLLAGEPNHRLLRSARFVAAAQTLPSYRMHDLGAFPAVVGGGEVAIIGEVYEVDSQTLADLDRLESHPDFYRRTEIELADGSRAETYLMRPERVDGYATIDSGDWARSTTTRNL